MKILVAKRKYLLKYINSHNHIDTITDVELNVFLETIGAEKINTVFFRRHRLTFFFGRKYALGLTKIFNILIYFCLIFILHKTQRILIDSITVISSSSGTELYSDFFFKICFLLNHWSEALISCKIAIVK